MLGSHNSLTFGNTKWYFRIFNIWAKCQSNSIFIQYNKGCRYFDFRIKLTDTGIQAAHGIVKYDTDIYYYLGLLDLWSTKEDPVYVRLVMEYNSIQSIQTEIEFEQIATKILATYKNIIYYGIYFKYSLNESHNLVGITDKNYNINLIPYKFKKINTVDKYSSVTGWKQIFLFPWLYAKLYNKKILNQYNNIIEDKNNVLLIDFV